MCARNLRIHASFAWAPRWYGLLKRLTWWDSRWQDNVAFNDIVATACKHRIQRHLAGEKLDDFFSFLLGDKNGVPNMLMLGEMTAECSVMLNAGSETTGIALSNLLYLLIVNPNALERLRREVDEALDGIEDTKVAPFARIRYLPYLKACIDEGYDFCHPAPPQLHDTRHRRVRTSWATGFRVILRCFVLPTASKEIQRYFRIPMSLNQSGG